MRHEWGELSFPKGLNPLLGAMAVASTEVVEAILDADPPPDPYAVCGAGRWDAPMCAVAFSNCGEKVLKVCLESVTFSQPSPSDKRNTIRQNVVPTSLHKP